MKKASKHIVKLILKKPNIDTNFGIKEVSETNLFEKFPHILRDSLDKIEHITPLRIALDDNHSMDIIGILLENSKTNPNECQSFVQVCKSGNLEMVQLFLNNPNIDINQGCPLAYCLENSEILSRFLTNTNLDLNIEDGLILKSAIKLSNQTKFEVITKLLSRKDLDVNRGFVFYELCSKGDLEIVKLFVNMRKDLKPDLLGPPIKHTGSEGFLDVESHKQAINFQFRPIEISYMNNHEELAQYLIENTRVKPLDISKLLFEDENEPGSFYKVNQNGKRELSSGIYALWTDDDEDKSSVYSSGKLSDF
ncbi:predicted protein [Naegleria gruberi]|uniref:Predicted protein n=1 Tax=Naegleria gruberi TaxID=5762 RepID=D2W2I0_NAEGR|nr:uncharacterized protein NAEGRDRAFT_54190 [Naegleria gruberi]EFC36749.1 predicted protein [Naegleria gruberi]|eukprot:XP_002669493.1 predicted protein [Naegleria gruberi strain NEG-M]